LFEDEKFVKVHLVGVATGPSLTLFSFLVDSGEGEEKEEGEGGGETPMNTLQCSNFSPCLSHE
jgi:hypothetical protein